MLIDSHTLQQDTEIHADICIVGAGTAGITLANELVDQSMSVALLESGGNKPDRESHALNEGQNIGRPYFSLDTSRARFLGGCCNRWNLKIGNGRLGARVRPLDAVDFEAREWIPYSGWPFDKTHLDPYYDRAQRICEVEPTSFDPQDWSDPVQRPVLQFNDERAQTVMFKFCPRDPFLKNYLDRIKKAPNIKTFLYGNVIDIETNETASTATGVKVACLHGPSFRVNAKIVVLALGGLETPRLLLLSNRVQSNGLGNGHDIVGRFFMEHPHFRLGYVVPFDADMINATALYNHIHLVDNVAVVAKISLAGDMIRNEKLLNFVTQFNPRIVTLSLLAQAMYPNLPSKSVKSYKAIRTMLAERTTTDLLHHLGNIVKGLDSVCVSAARKVKRDFIRHFNKKQVPVYWLETMCEQAPNPNSRVLLSDSVDQLGQTRISLDWQLSQNDIESAIRSQRILDEVLQASGIGRLYCELDDLTPPRRITGGWHQMGTTRMHDDPKQGVVDSNSRVHGLSNLFIAGPSVFPTTGYANPTLTIVAMTVRLADHLKAMMRG
jgi:choline dehydrogenase-like flavoprotein